MRHHSLSGLAVFLALVLNSMPLRGATEMHVEIDRAIAAAADGPLASPVSDTGFLRRVFLDFAGKIPTSAEAKDFLADQAPDKRTKLIDRLLAAPEFPERLEEAVTVMLLERRSGGKIAERQWRDWLRGQFAANRPWNEIVRELLAWEGDPAATPAAKFMLNDEKFDAQKLTHDVARLLLGMNLQCAQCHDHPTVKGFTQADFYGLFAYLAQTDVKPDKVSKGLVLAEAPPLGKIEFKSVFKPEKEFTAPHVPGGTEVLIPAFAPGEEYAVKPGKDGSLGVPSFRLRPMLSRDLTAEGNRHFAQNSVNRFWFFLMGRGLVHPLDMMHRDNPPSHPSLLEQLADEFVARKFDVQWLLREIALSESYQRSTAAPAGADLDSVKPESYRIANLRPLSAEQIGRATMLATGSWDSLAKDGPVKPGNYLTSATTALPTTRPEALTVFVRTFAGPPGEPEVEFAPSMSHSLFLMNDRMVLEWLKSRDNNLTARLGKMASGGDVAEELYLSVLSRLPEPSEIEEVESFLKKNEARRETAIGELAWALLASAEFRLNH